MRITAAQSTLSDSNAQDGRYAADVTPTTFGKVAMKELRDAPQISGRYAKGGYAEQQERAADQDEGARQFAIDTTSYHPASTAHDFIKDHDGHDKSQGKARAFPDGNPG